MCKAECYLVASKEWGTSDYSVWVPKDGTCLCSDNPDLPQVSLAPRYHRILFELAKQASCKPTELGVAGGTLRNYLCALRKKIHEIGTNADDNAYANPIILSGGIVYINRGNSDYPQKPVKWQSATEHATGFSEATTCHPKHTHTDLADFDPNALLDNGSPMAIATRHEAGSIALDDLVKALHAYREAQSTQSEQLSARALWLIESGREADALREIEQRVGGCLNSVDRTADVLDDYFDSQGLRINLLRKMKPSGVVLEEERSIRSDLYRRAVRHNTHPDVVMEYVEFLSDCQRYGEAILPARQAIALDVLNETGGARHARNLVNLAETLYRTRSDIRGSTAYAQEALGVLEGSADALSLSLSARAHKHIGNVHRRECDYEQALNAYRKAAKIVETIEDEKCQSIYADTVNCIAIAHRAMGEVDIALELHLQNLERRKELLEHASPERRLYEQDRLARTHGNVGYTLRRLAERSGADRPELLARAESHLLQAIELRKDLVEVNDFAAFSRLSTSFLNYANVLFELGRKAEAVKYYTKAIDSRKRLAKADPQTYRFGLAIAYSAKGSSLLEDNPDSSELREAAKCLSKAAEIREDYLKESLDTERMYRGYLIRDLLDLAKCSKLMSESSDGAMPDCRQTHDRSVARVQELLDMNADTSDLEESLMERIESIDWNVTVQEEE